MRLLTLLLSFALVGALRAETRASRVDITSQPEGATVVVDGADRGPTPITLFDLKPGRHLLKYRLAGYTEHVGYFSVTEGQVLRMSEVLHAEKGLFLLTSEPSGCAITVDGSASGQTPRLFTDLKVNNSYRMTLSAEGYRSQSFDVQLNDRKPVVRKEILIRDSGTVTVTSEPSGAFVTVNGVERGATPVTVSGVPKGRATIRLRMDGYQEETREISMNAGEEQRLAIALTGLPGTLSLSSVPAGARFYVDGEYRGKGEVTLSGLAPRDYVVRAELEGFGTQQRVVSIANGATPREEFRLSNVKGRCELRTTPSGVQVLLDGKTVGTTKSSDPDSEMSDVFHINDILEGEHTLTLRKDGFGEKTFHVAVKGCETVTRKYTLRRIFKPDVEVETESRTYRGVMKRIDSDLVIVETQPGIDTPIQRVNVRKITPLTGNQ